MHCSYCELGEQGCIKQRHRNNLQVVHAARDAAGRIHVVQLWISAHLLDVGMHVSTSPALQSRWPLSVEHCLQCACQSVLKSFKWCLQEIDELCEDWQPEPLFSHLTEAQKAYEPPVVSRCNSVVMSSAFKSNAL